MPKEYERDWIERAHWFAVRVLKLAAKLPRNPPGWSMAGQICRSAPSVPFNMEEAKAALTLADTLTKTGTARKECAETRRALLLIRDSELLPTTPELTFLIAEGTELTAMLSSGAKRLSDRIAKEPGPKNLRTSWPVKP
jgi:four helix bundle protein